MKTVNASLLDLNNKQNNEESQSNNIVNSVNVNNNSNTNKTSITNTNKTKNNQVSNNNQNNNVNGKYYNVTSIVDKTSNVVVFKGLLPNRMESVM